MSYSQKLLVQKKFVGHPVVNGMTAWLVKDRGDTMEWTFIRMLATAFDTAEAIKLIAEAKRVRPDDSYELISEAQS